METKFEETSTVEFLKESVQLIEEGKNESALRHNISAYLPRIFPDMPWWVKEHAKCAETKTVFHRPGRTAWGFVDTLVGATAIEYEKNINNPRIFETGFGQVKDYCADLLNKDIPQDLIIGVLSDTVRWKAYRISNVKLLSAVPDSTVFGRDHLTLDEIDGYDFSAAGPSEAKLLSIFLEKHLGRMGARRLNAGTLSSDLGFNSVSSEPHLSAISSLVDSAFLLNRDYADLIERLWGDFISYLGGESAGGFKKVTYVGELYILTLAKLICANILSGKALTSNETELETILNGTFFQNRGLSNLVEYDYFGWLNAPPHVQGLLPVATDIQKDLIAYDFASPPTEDIFGELLAQLAGKSQRLLLGQEWTPSWLAELLVENTLMKIPQDQEPRLVDMCCGSGAMVVEAVKQVKARLLTKGIDAGSNEALSKLSEAITGFDIDPLAVMLAKIGWVLAAREWLNVATPVSIPIYHADSLFAATPLTQVVDESGATHHEMLLDKEKVMLPAFLISPERRALFDLLMDKGYVVAMESAKSERSEISTDLVTDLVSNVINSAGCSLTGEERTLLMRFASELLSALENLQRGGQNGIWAFVLRNSYRPALVAGKFNGIVSNPPWLALSKVASNPYTEVLKKKAEEYAIKPPGPAHLHVEMSTIFLLNAVERYLISDAAIGCVLPESIMSAHNHHPFRKASYASAPRPVHLRVDELWRVVEKRTFKNEAVVLFGTKTQPTTADIPGFDVSRDDKKTVAFMRIELGAARSAWSDKKSLGAKNAGFFNPAPFRQGADVMPRTLVFHTLQNAGGAWNASPITRQSNESYLNAGAKTHKDFSMTVNGMNDDVVFDVLLSHHLTPFDIGEGAKGVLPIARDVKDVWEAVPLMKIIWKGLATLNAFRSIFKALGLLTSQGYFERIDTNKKKLTKQVWASGWFVFQGAGGQNVCAAYAKTLRFPKDKSVIDQTLYWVVVKTEDEAVYLTGLLNSNAINECIKEFQPRGQQGGRHVHKLAFGVTPPFDPGNAAHADVVVKTRLLIREWAAYQAANTAEVHDLLNPNKSSLPIRRKSIKNILVTLSSWQDYENACKAVYCVV
jgi:hypothetical protein